MAEPILVITGPTASGKSAVALEVAARIGGEIISMDSRQVYRGLDIGTAKPSTTERAAVPHHGLDLIGPNDRYSAGRFAEDARRWIAAIQARGRVAVVVGGTGFFLRALLQPLFLEPELETRRREDLKRWLGQQPLDTLAKWAVALDPRHPDRPTDAQRLARRIEVALLSGRSLSWWQAHARPAAEPLPAVCFLLDLPRDILYRRINERVHAMLAAGLVEEVRALLQRGYTADDPGMNATGYIELIPHLQGDRPLAEAVTLIQNATRRYARRQLTWFRGQLPAQCIRLAADRPVSALADDIVAEWRRVR